MSLCDLTLCDKAGRTCVYGNAILREEDAMPSLRLSHSSLFHGMEVILLGSAGQPRKHFVNL